MAGVGGGASCAPLVAKVPVHIRPYTTAVLIFAPVLPPESVLSASVLVPIRVGTGQNVPAQEQLVVVSRTKLYFYQSRLFTKSGWSECFSTSSFNMKVATAGVIHSLACTPKIITRDVTKRSHLH